MSAAARGGDNCGLLVFGRKIMKFLPPQKGIRHLEAVLEALHDLEPELIEPSYSRAFQFVAANSKKRSLVVILTDLVDKESSKELINSLKLLRPRHLPLVVTIGDRDLNQTVSEVPGDIKNVFIQSAAEEIIRQRESALRIVETLGGLALDVNTSNLAPRLLETYLRVKERGCYNKYRSRPDCRRECVPHFHPKSFLTWRETHPGRSRLKSFLTGKRDASDTAVGTTAVLDSGARRNQKISRDEEYI